MPAAAANGDPLILGQVNSATDPTRLQGGLSITSSDGINTPLQAIDDSSDGVPAIHAKSDSWIGIRAETVGGPAAINGVASNPFCVGVYATNTGGGPGLAVYGKVNFLTRSGRATVAAGRAYVDIDLRQKGGMSGTPLCFANMTSYRPGVHIAAVRPNYPVAG